MNTYQHLVVKLTKISVNDPLLNIIFSNVNLDLLSNDIIKYTHKILGINIPRQDMQDMVLVMLPIFLYELRFGRSDIYKMVENINKNTIEECLTQISISKNLYISQREKNNTTVHDVEKRRLLM